MDFTLPERIVALPLDVDGTPLDKTLCPYDPTAPDPAREMEHRPFSPADYAAPKADADRPAMPAVAARPVPRKREKAKAEFIGEKALGRMYTLEHPLRVDGVEYRETRMSSPPGSKFSDFQALMEGGIEEHDLAIWLTCDLPLDVIENLSFDDKLYLRQEGVPFLPRQFRERMGIPADNAANETTTPTT